MSLTCFQRNELSLFSLKLYRQIVGIPMGTNCVTLVADLFLFCYERDSMTSLSDVKQAEIIEAYNSTSRYLDDLLNIDNHYFEDSTVGFLLLQRFRVELLLSTCLVSSQ